MGLGPDAVNVGACGVEKSKMRKKKDDDDTDIGDKTSCWFKFGFLGRCISMPSGSKVDSSISGTSTQDGNLMKHFY